MAAFSGVVQVVQIEKGTQMTCIRLFKCREGYVLLLSALILM